MLLGGGGFFGSAIAEQLRRRGSELLTPSHHQVDVEDGDALRSTLQPRDVVIDAAGPFHKRTTTLLEVAIEVGFDVIDLSDNLSYALAVHAMNQRLNAAGVRVLTSCSAVSAVTAAAVHERAITEPTRVAVCLLPASRDSSSAGTAASLLRSLSRPIRVLRGGQLVSTTGWSRSRIFSVPGRGAARGYLAESADAVNLPRVWPSMRDVDFFVDTQAFGMNHLITAAMRLPVRERLLAGLAPIGLPLAKVLGTRAGGYVVEVADDRRVMTTVLMAERRSYMTAVLPATLAARSLATGSSPPPGVVPSDRLCDPDKLFAELRSSGIKIAHY